MPERNRQGLEMAQRQAKDELARLREEYLDALRAQAVVVAVLGSNEHVDAFVRLAREEGVQIVVDVASPYRALANGARQSMAGGTTWTFAQVQRVWTELEVTLRELGVRQVTRGAPDIAERVLQSPEEVLAATRDLVRQTVRAQLIHPWMRQQLLNQALTAGVDTTKSVPVLFVGAASDEEARELQAGWPSVFSVVHLDRVPDADFVVAAFMRTRSQVTTAAEANTPTETGPGTPAPDGDESSGGSEEVSSVKIDDEQQHDNQNTKPDTKVNSKKSNKGK